MRAKSPRLSVTVAEVVEVNPLIKRFRFVRTDGQAMPPFSGCAHIVVDMDDQGALRINPYSLMSNPADLSGYSISVRRDDTGRGGSLFLHQQVRQGMQMQVSYPVNLFSLDQRAKKHLMIAGGIGITPFISQMAQLMSLGGRFELHYSVRNREVGAYIDELKSLYGERIHVYFDDDGDKIQLDSLLASQFFGTHLYVCGPKGMISWVRSTAEMAGWPAGSIHSEEFLAPPVGEPFTVELLRSKKTITVGASQSLLEAMEAADVEAPYLCRGGACGQCETDVVRLDGRLEHNDHWLTDEQKASNQLIMPCVSRFRGKDLVLDR